MCVLLFGQVRRVFFIRTTPTLILMLLRNYCRLRNLVVQLSGVFLKPPLCLLAEGVANVTVMEPDSISVVFAVAFHGVVGEVALSHFKIWIDHNLHDVVSRSDVCDVDPLAVDVVTVQIPAAHGDALVTKIGTLVPFRSTFLAV